MLVMIIRQKTVVDDASMSRHINNSRKRRIMDGCHNEKDHAIRKLRAVVTVPTVSIMRITTILATKVKLILNMTLISLMMMVMMMMMMMVVVVVVVVLMVMVLMTMTTSMRRRMLLLMVMMRMMTRIRMSMVVANMLNDGHIPRSGIRLADMQKRERTCKKGCPRWKKISGKCWGAADV